MIKPYNWIHNTRRHSIMKVRTISNNIGISLYDLERYEEAIQMYNKAV